MDARTTIGDYEVRLLGRFGSVVRYEATHIVLPRRAFIETLADDAPRIEAMKLMRRACILEALQHPAVPRVFECGRSEGRPWIALAHEEGISLHDELAHRGLEMREALTLLEEVAAFLSHAHSRGVLHGNITAAAIVRAPTLRIQGWENARLHDGHGAFDGREDVFALATTIATSVARPEKVSGELARLLARMFSAAPKRPSAAEVVTAARAIRDAMGSFDRVEHVEIDRAIDALGDMPEIEIEYGSEPSAEPPEDVDDDVILLEHRRLANDTVIVDLDAH